MPHSFGYRARTRDMFARDFGKNGVNELSIYLRKYKVKFGSTSLLSSHHIGHRVYTQADAL